MGLYHEAPFQVALNDGLWRLAAQTGMQEDRLRRTFVLEQLLTRLLADSPDRWVRYDDWRLEFRHDGPVTARDLGDGVDPHARATVDNALRVVSDGVRLEPLQLTVRARGQSRQMPDAPALAYGVEARDHDGTIGSVDLIVAFDFPASEDIELIAGLNVLPSKDMPPPRLPDPCPAHPNRRPLRRLREPQEPVSRLGRSAHHRQVRATRDVHR